MSLSAGSVKAPEKPRRVSWGTGRHRKTGEIVLDVPAQAPNQHLSLEDFVAAQKFDLSGYDLSRITALSRYVVLLRDHASYLVSVERGVGKKPSLFWPRVAGLTFLEEGH